MTSRTAVDVRRVDPEGIEVVARGEDRAVDVLFDDRRIWSFWVHRDTEHGRRGLRTIGWPQVMSSRLRGRSTVTLVEHVSGARLWSDEVVFGAPEDADARVVFEDKQGNPISLDKDLRFSATFGVRSKRDLDPLLDAVDDLLALLAEQGVAAFPAYGTLLGAVREGDFLGHDSDADLGYVSAWSTPVDACRESFRLQRAVAAAGYRTHRYSGLAFRVSVEEADGTTRGLDVFGGFLDEGTLYLMGEVGTPFEREWIHPLGTCTLAGRELPAPARPDKLLEAMYGPHWRTPDPAFKFETSAAVQERFNQWFRGTAYNRRDWERRASLRARKPVPSRTSRLAKQLRRDHAAAPQTHVLDVGAGRGADAVWLARRGFDVTAYDFAPRQLEKAARLARRRDLPLETRELNLTELRSVLSEGGRLARGPARERAMLARHVLDATDDVGRQGLARFAAMTLRGGGRLYADVWTGRGGGARGLVPVRLAEVEELLVAHGATILRAKETPAGERGSGSAGKVVAQWA